MPLRGLIACRCAWRAGGRPDPTEWDEAMLRLKTQHDPSTADGTRCRMPLSRRDLEQIRALVRDELQLALGDQYDGNEVNKGETNRDDGLSPRQRRIRAVFARMRRESKERTARPIPDSPFVDLYDAGRLLEATGISVGRGGSADGSPSTWSADAYSSAARRLTRSSRAMRSAGVRGSQRDIGDAWAIIELAPGCRPHHEDCMRIRVA